MSSPLLSVVTICNENLQGLKETFESLRPLKDHLGEHYEQIVIDSSPEAHREVRSLKLAHSVKWIESLKEGIYPALNKGNMEARGEIIWHLHSGDILYDFDELQLAMETFLADATAALLFSPMVRKNITGDLFLSDLSPSYRLNLVLKGCVYHPGVLFRRSIFQKIGAFDVSYKIAGDVKAFVEVANQNLKTIFYPKPFVQFDNTGLSQTELLLSHEETARAMSHFHFRAHEKCIYSLRHTYHTLRLKKVVPFLKRIGIYQCIHQMINFIKSNFRRHY